MQREICDEQGARQCQTTTLLRLPTGPAYKLYTLAVVCLLLGMAGGWLIRGSQSSAAAAPAETASAPAPTGMGGAMNGQPVNGQPTPDQLKQMADAQAAPLIEKLKADPNNPELLAGIGNYYYDAQQYQSPSTTTAAHSRPSRPTPPSHRYGHRLLVFGQCR